MNIFELWTKTLVELERQLDPKRVDTWLRPLQIVSFGNGLFELMADGNMFRDRVMGMLPSVEQAFLQVAGQRCAIKIRIKGDGALPMKRPRSVVTTLRNDGQAVLSQSTSNGRGDQSFETFVVGDGNRLAHLVMTQLSRGERDEVVYIYGGVGTGKTHLLMAAQTVLKGRAKSVLYLRGDEFSRRVKQSASSRLFDELRHEVVRAEAFLLDGVQDVERRAQKCLWSILDTRLQASQPTVLAGDSEPGELELPQGLLAMIGDGHELTLDMALRHRIFSTKVAAAGMAIEESVLERLVPHLKGSVREIEGLVSRLRREPRGIGLAVLEGEVKLVTSPFPGRANGSLDDIIQTVAYLHGLTKEQLKARDRTRRVAQVRHLAAYFSRKLTPSSYPEIGAELGGRNHTSIIRAVQTVEKWIADNAPEASRVAEIEQVLVTKPIKEKEKVA